MQHWPRDLLDGHVNGIIVSSWHFLPTCSIDLLWKLTVPTDVLSSELIQGRKKYVLFIKQGEACAVRSPSIFLQCSDCFLSYHNLEVLGLPIANAVCLMIEEPEVQTTNMRWRCAAVPLYQSLATCWKSSDCIISCLKVLFSEKKAARIIGFHFWYHWTRQASTFCPCSCF